MSSSYRVLMLALHVLFVLATCMYATEATFVHHPCPPSRAPPPPQNNTLTFYLHVVLANGTNNNVANMIPIAGIQGKAFTPQQFGTLYVFDVNITATPSPNSTVIGHDYGTITVVSLNGSIYMISSTYVFACCQYAGSTLETLGIFNNSQQVSNLSIIGGTNALTYATGYVAYEIIAMKLPNFVVQVIANFKIAA